ncbi:uncharacterized protein [Littorina saxatilis]|uniref:uncharacterized protein n=1 Tax=Littorina saxatilis TaxID=31220 RepID=UPI0038B684D6
MSPLSVLSAMLVVVVLSGPCLARSQNRERYPRNITGCDSGPSGLDSFSWSAFSGRWYVARISAPLGPSLRDISGYVIDIDGSTNELGTSDKNLLDVLPAERKETLYRGDSRRCTKREWRCVRERGTSRTDCRLNTKGRGAVLQRSVVMATDYMTTAAVARETYVNGRFLSKQINLVVRDPQADPDPNVISRALFDYCGRYAADPNSEFYESFSNDPNPYCMDYDYKV